MELFNNSSSSAPFSSASDTETKRPDIDVIGNWGLTEEGRNN